MLKAICALLLITIASSTEQTGRTRLSERPVGLYGSMTIALPASTDPETLAVTAFMVAQGARVPLGIEITPMDNSTRDARLRVRPLAASSADTLSGRSLGDALDRLIGTTQGYQWLETGEGVINILPQSLAARQDGMLNRTVSEFRVVNSSLLEALTSVHRIFDPDFAVAGGFKSLIGEPEAVRQIEQKRQEDEARPLTLLLYHPSVREILNALVLAHGDITWELSYSAQPPVYKNCLLRIRGFNGWATALRPRPNFDSKQ